MEGNSSNNSQKELKIALDFLLRMSKEDPEKLRKNVYNSLSSLSYLAIEGKKADFQDGWAAALKDSDGNPLFDTEEASILESVSRNVIKPMFEKEPKETQEGGALSLKASSMKGLIDYNASMPGAISINPEDVSIDATFWKIKDFLAKIDKQTHDLARSFGPFKFFYETTVDPRIPIPVPIPAPPFVAVIMVPIPARAIPVVIGALVESIRLIFGVGALSNDTARKALSIVMSLIDLLKGDWKQSILSLLGYFGQSPLIIGLIMKTFLNIFNLIAPDIQDRIIFDIYQSTKSMFIGFFLWGFATFAPDAVRNSARIQFDQMARLVDNSNDQIQKIEESMQKSVDSAGLKIQFNRIPPGFVPTFDDIQNLQSIARQPSIYCSKEFQEAVAPLRLIPPLRIVLELLSIPTDEKTLDFECRGLRGESLEETMESQIMPSVTAEPDSPLGQALEGPEIPELPKVPGLTEVPGVPEIPGVSKALAEVQLETTPEKEEVKPKEQAKPKEEAKPKDKEKLKAKKGGTRKRT